MTIDGDELIAEKRGPGRKGVTAEQVFAAADSLRSSNREPTVQAVQGVLGTGSTGTIAAHLRTWRSAKYGTAPAASIPDALAKALQAFAANACAELSAQWQTRMQPVDDDNAVLTEMVTCLQREKEQQVEELGQARSERDALKGRLGEQADEIQRLRDAETARQVKQVEARIGEAQVHQERDMHLQSLMSVELELKKARQDRDAKADELNQTKVALARAEAQLENVFDSPADFQPRQATAQRRPLAGRRAVPTARRRL